MKSIAKKWRTNQLADDITCTMDVFWGENGTSEGEVYQDEAPVRDQSGA
jgi:hypothetical protein